MQNHASLERPLLISESPFLYRNTSLQKNSGITEEYLNKIENAKREPKARMIIRLGRGLGIPPGDLLNEMDRLMRLEETE